MKLPIVFVKCWKAVKRCWGIAVSYTHLNDRTVDLSAGTDLSNFMTTAKDFTNYRKPINTNILNGIPNSDASMCFYIKMRTTVLGYRSSDKTTWIAGYTNGTLSKFETFITHEQITASTPI